MFEDPTNPRPLETAPETESEPEGPSSAPPEYPPLWPEYPTPEFDPSLSKK